MPKKKGATLVRLNPDDLELLRNARRLRREVFKPQREAAVQVGSLRALFEELPQGANLSGHLASNPTGIAARLAGVENAAAEARRRIEVLPGYDPDLFRQVVRAARRARRAA